MSILKIFVIEDEPYMAELLQYHLELNPDNDVTMFTKGKDLLNALTQNPDVVLTDYYLNGETGEQILKKVHEKIPDLPVVIVSGQEDINVAVSILKEGAFDYIVKDDSLREKLWALMARVRNQGSLRKMVGQLQTEVQNKYDFESSIIGQSKALRNIYPLVEKACKSSIVVSISGQTGTGKEVLAKSIHFNSARKNKPFVAVNMAAIPKELIESELFGHEKGSFTGANDRRTGKFEEANGGTIFLDEIGEMDLAMQSKLLRVLQEQQVVRVGGNQLIDLDVRVIIATHKNLYDEVGKGNFREDLYYRLLGISIELPALRDRDNDVALLSRYFVSAYCKKQNIPVKKIDPRAIDKLMAHSFPGNIRELKSIIELAVVLSDSEVILPDHIQIRNGNFLETMLSQELSLKEYNEEIVKHYMKRYNNRVRQVADKLGIGKSTIYRMLGETEPVEDEKNQYTEK